MTAYRYRPGRYRLRRRNANAEKIIGLAAGFALAAASGTAAATSGHTHVTRPAVADAVTAGKPATIRPAQVAGSGETSFIAAVLADLAAPDSSADQRSMAAWAAHEGCWGCVGANNQWDTTLVMPGSWNFNTFGDGLHVQSYPTAAEGAQATALTIEGGYPGITAALRSGNGICGAGFAYELGRWSGGGYEEVC